MAQTAEPMLVPTQRFPGYMGEHPYIQQGIDDTEMRARRRVYGPPSMLPTMGFEREGGGTWGRPVTYLYGPQTPLPDWENYDHAVMWERYNPIPKKDAPTAAVPAQLLRNFPYTPYAQAFRAPTISEILNVIGGPSA